MKTLERFVAGLESLPTAVAWYLEDIGESRGRQELFLRQSPHILNALQQHALIESAISSNRIEGVEVEQARVATVLFGHLAYKDRNEAEVRGYRDALDLIHTGGAGLPIQEDTVLTLHKLSRGSEAADGGKYKNRDIDIIQTLPGGGSRVRFKTVPATETAAAMDKLFRIWGQGVDDRCVPFLVLLAALNLDFLCIHPFRDGNGRVSRLLLLLGCYHAGIEAGRYISIEKTIEENKEAYYDALEMSSAGWHEGGHDPWPYIRFVLYVIKAVSGEFERRVGQMEAPRGAKTQMIEQALGRTNGEFTLAEIERACPGVSRDLIRKVMKTFRARGFLACAGRGPGAKWQKRGTWP